MDTGGYVRCGRCGNENSEGNRFCGMCGASLVPKMETANRTVASSADKRPEAATNPTGEVRQPTRLASDVTVSAANRPPAAGSTVAAQIPRPPAEPAPASSIPNPPRNGGPVNSDPVISGPSFLGLNKPADGRSRQAYSGRGHDLRTSGNLDYLLDDDEEEPKRGGGKLFLVVIALALIGGFGYLRWKQGGFDFLKPSRAVAPAAQNATDSGNTPSGNTAPAPASAPEAAAPNPAVPNPAAPTAVTPSSANPNPSNPAAANPNPPAADSGATGATPAPAASGAASSGTGATPPEATPANSGPAPSVPADIAAPDKPQNNASSDKPAQSESAEDAEAGPSKPEAPGQPDVAKPSAARTLRARKPTPVTPLDPVAEAEKFIYGQSVAQDCDRGLRLLKPAATQANTKAMILLGSLYSSGTCTPRDLPTAYRWFALSLHKEPDNQRLQDDLQKLWSQMTQPERQLAIKLSQ
ncbi:MAG: zinc-ribbon domain-containing protein [Candidatus Sulfotelmatobacter sp.]